MRFSDLNINFNKQACSHTFQRNFESLRSWGSGMFQVLQNHPYALHNHSPQVISGVILAINGVVFLAMRSFADAIEASLNKRFPTIPTIHLMISSAILGGTVGALNLALFKLARVPASVNLLYIISISSAILRLVLKSPTSSRATQIPLPSHTLPPQLSTHLSHHQPKPPLPIQFPPKPISQPLSENEHPSQSLLTQQSEFPENEQPDEHPLQPILIRNPPKRSPNADFLTPMPSTPLLREPHKLTLTPLNPSTPPRAPAAVPQLNVKDVEDVETKVLEEIKQLEAKKDKMNTLLKRYEALIQQCTAEMTSAYKRREGSTASRISAQLLGSQQGRQQVQSFIENLDKELVVQRNLLEAIRKKKLGAMPSEHPSVPGTPEAKFRQQLIKSASFLSLKVQEPPLQAHVGSLELNQSLNSPERETADLFQPLTTGSDLLETHATFLQGQLPLDFSDDDEQLDQLIDDDDEYEYEDDEGYIYRQIVFPDGKCMLVDKDGNCFDLNGNHIGALIANAFSDSM